VVDEDWQQLLGVASQLRRAGRIDEAIAAYKRLLALKPDLADSWYNLAWLERQARQFDDALRSYRKALDLNVAEPEEVHLNRAVIYSDHLHQPEEAARELEAALTKNVVYVPALLNLGNLREDLGNHEGAHEAYARALAADPDNRLALARLAGVSDSQEARPALVERLRAALRSPGASASEQADLGFALAGMLDAAGEYEQAFEAARAANLASRTATGARYDRARAEQFVDQLIAVFDSPAPIAAAHASPLFICGMFRSGSTLIEQILGSHSHVLPAGELDFIPQLAARIRGYPQSVAMASKEAIESWREFYLRSLSVKPERNILVTDKRPENFLHIGLIKTIFPSAKIVHTRRNRLDNLLSLYFLHLDPAMAYALDLEDAAHWYGQYRRLMVHWATLYPGDILDVDYDELVHEPNPALERLLGFLKLDWEDGLLNFHRTGLPIKTASVWQVRQPLHARSSGRWRNYSEQLNKLVGDE
jgi:tetratricopeptide (TPR) repeat protein